MNDMRRTMLWVVFSMSLFLLYDGWNKANGKPSLFSPVAVTKPAAAPAAGSAAVPTVGASGVLPTSTLPTSTAAATPAAVPAVLPTAAPAATLSEKVTITTDVVKATLDTQGGDVVRLELLQQLDHTDRTKNTLVFDQSTERLYKAQTGLIPAPGGAALPNHLTRMTLLPGDRDLKAGSNELQVKFESPDVGGAKLVKTFTFKRGDYVVAVKHEVVNTGTAAIKPASRVFTSPSRVRRFTPTRPSSTRSTSRPSRSARPTTSLTTTPRPTTAG
jgi:YidC/Oxa1 family membrane protein insertase